MLSLSLDLINYEQTSKYSIGAQVKKLNIVNSYNIQKMKSKQSKLQGKGKIKNKAKKILGENLS